jgi:hypothetical protein
VTAFYVPRSAAGLTVALGVSFVLAEHATTLAGYTRDLPQQQRLRDVIGMEWGDGTAQIQKLVVARSLSCR